MARVKGKLIKQTNPGARFIGGKGKSSGGGGWKTSGNQSFVNPTRNSTPSKPFKSSGGK